MFPRGQYRRGYGLDVEAGRVVVVRAARGRAAVVPEVLWDGPAEPGSAEFAGVVRSLADDAERGQAVASGAVCVRDSVTRWLTTPFPSVSKARKVLPSLLDIQMPFPLDSCSYLFLEVSRSDQGVRALAVAARIETLQARLEAFRALGMDPAVLDHEGLALWAQSVAELPVEAGAVRVVAHVGAEHCALVWGQGLRFEGARSCRRGARDFTGPKAAEAVADFADRARQVLQAGIRERAGGAIQWVWTGPGAEDPACLAALEQALALDSSAGTLRHERPGTFLARALAARAMEGGALVCNLRTGALVHPQQVRQAARARVRVAAAHLALGLFLCLLALAWQGVLRYRTARADAALARLAGELARGAPMQKGQEVLMVGRALDQQRPLDTAFLEAFRPSLTVMLEGMLGTARGNAMTFETLSLRSDFVSAQGTCEDWSASRRLEEFLAGEGFTVEVERQDAIADERVHFSVKGVRSHE